MTQWILDALRAHGAWSVFAGVLLEQVIIPIPSPAIIMGAGWILIPAREPFLSALMDMAVKIVLPGTAASALGAWALYYVGLWGGRAFVNRFQGYLGFTWKDVEAMGRRMALSGEAATLFFMRALPVVPLSLVSLVAGVVRVPFGVFLLWSVLGTLARCFLLALLGWRLGSGAMNWARGVNRYESLVSLFLVAVVAAGIVMVRRQVRRGMEKEAGKN